MATTIDWHTKTINVLRADMLLLQTNPIEVRQLNIDDFRSDLNALQASEDGMWADTTHDLQPADHCCWCGPGSGGEHHQRVHGHLRERCHMRSISPVATATFPMWSTSTTCRYGRRTLPV